MAQRYIKLIDGCHITEEQRLKLMKRYLNEDVSVTVEQGEKGNIIVTPQTHVQVEIDRKGNDTSDF